MDENAELGVLGEAQREAGGEGSVEREVSQEGRVGSESFIAVGLGFGGGLRLMLLSAASSPCVKWVWRNVHLY